MQEFDKIPMFMKEAPEEIDPQQYPELACLQALIHDQDRPPAGSGGPRASLETDFLDLMMLTSHNSPPRAS